MPDPTTPIARAQAFCQRFALRLPILMAPMAGACPASLAAAIATAGGMGACGALLMSPEQIRGWAAEVRAASNGPFQFNLWIPGPAPQRDAAHEAEVRAFLGQWGPEPPPEAGDLALIDFDAQCEALTEGFRARGRGQLVRHGRTQALRRRAPSSPPPARAALSTR